MSTRRETVRLIASAIAPLYDPREAESIARMVVMEALGVDFTHLVADYDAPCAIEGLDDMSPTCGADDRYNTYWVMPGSAASISPSAKGY